MEKTKLYFIPGTMCDPLIWSKVWPKLESQFELVHLPIPNEDNIEAILSSLLASFEEPSVNVIGFSMGGYLATCLAERQPQMFNRVLVIANSPCALPDAELQQRKQTISWLTRFQYRGITEQKAQSMLADNVDKPNELIEIIESMEQNLGYDTLLTQLEATSFRLDKSSFLKSKKVSMSFCYGEQDKLVNRIWLQSLAEQFGLTTHQVAHCGHMLPLEQPEQLVQIIEKTFG